MLLPFCAGRLWMQENGTTMMANTRYAPRRVEHEKPFCCVGLKLESRIQNRSVKGDTQHVEERATNIASYKSRK